MIKTFKTSVIILMILNILYFYSFVHAYIETKFFPVTENTRILNIEPYDNQLNLVTIEADKIRNCRFDDFRWFMGDYNGMSTFIHADLYGETEDDFLPRGIGEDYIIRVLVPLSEYNILNNSYIELEHRCHPFFKTHTIEIL